MNNKELEELKNKQNTDISMLRKELTPPALFTLGAAGFLVNPLANLSEGLTIGVIAATFFIDQLSISYYKEEIKDCKKRHKKIKKWDYVASKPYLEKILVENGYTLENKTKKEIKNIEKDINLKNTYNAELLFNKNGIVSFSETNNSPKGTEKIKVINKKK
jgi:hypothetical protein